jgi:membrane protease YdiL (CAAX protease family)
MHLVGAGLGYLILVALVTTAVLTAVVIALLRYIVLPLPPRKARDIYFVSLATVVLGHIVAVTMGLWPEVLFMWQRDATNVFDWYFDLLPFAATVLVACAPLARRFHAAWPAATQIIGIAFIASVIGVELSSTDAANPFNPARWVVDAVRFAIWLAIAIAGVKILHRGSAGDAVVRLGLSIGSARTRMTAVSAAALLMIGLVAGTSPFRAAGLEVLFRGFVFRQLHQHARWSFVPAALMSLMGMIDYGPDVSPLALGARIFVTLLIANGGLALLLAWLFRRWYYDLWFPISVHILLNLTTVMFSR